MDIISDLKSYQQICILVTLFLCCVPQSISGSIYSNEGQMANDQDFVLRLYVIRHGETLANIEAEVAGQAESPLTDLGERQALALGRSGRIQPADFWRFYTSDLERAQRTGQLILSGAENASKNEKRANFRTDDRLRELSKGAREGFPKTLSTAEAVEARRLAKQKRGEKYNAEDIPRLETEQEGYKRFVQWLYEVVRDAGNEKDGSRPPFAALAVSHAALMRTLVVSHSALIRAFLVHMFSREDLVAHGAAFGADGRLIIPNTSITIVDIMPSPNHDNWKQRVGLAPVSKLDPSESGYIPWTARLVKLTWTGHYESLPENSSKTCATNVR